MAGEIDVGAVINDYINNHMSASQLAQKYKTYTNKILRTLRKMGVDIKDKSDVQKEALGTGQRAHPMKGKHHKKESKDKIGHNVMLKYESFSEDRKKEIGEKHAKSWKERSEESIIDMRQKGAKAIRISSQEGSKLEKYLYEHLQNRGMMVLMHQNISENANLEVDLIINNVAVEVQGPSHYEPIYGEEKLMKTQQADMEKLNSLLKFGYSVIYIKHTCKKKSDVHYKGVLNLLLETFKEVEGKNMHKEICYE